MRTTFLLMLILIASCETAEVIAPEFYNCVSYATNTADKTHAEKLQTYINDLTARGVPGMILTIDHPKKGYWTGAAGMADIANNVPMQTCNISRAGSTVKTYTATAILLLAEEGKLSLDDKAAIYLPAHIVKKIDNADVATIRQLLNHTSGIYNYIQDLKFQTASLNDLTRVWQPEELLSYAYGRKSYFEPGASCQYTNTGYILLGMIIEKVSGLHFSKFFEQRIFKPLRLQYTSFNIDDPIPHGLVRGYVDMYSNKQLVEATHFSGWDYYTADGGLISNTQDMAVFIRSLFEARIISDRSLEEMEGWVDMPDGASFFNIKCGLGVFKIETPYGIAYHHSGDAIGYYATMLYFPETGVSIAWQTNGNYGSIDPLISSKEAFDAMMKLAFE
ncbi:MAG: serine hydrolase domain-containing protein [Bacteroidota bacterium]